VRHPAADHRRDPRPLDGGEATGEEHHTHQQGYADPDHREPDAEPEPGHHEHQGDQAQREADQDELRVATELAQDAQGRRGDEVVVLGIRAGGHAFDVRHRTPPFRSRRPPNRG
jgi:hypothetical protein